MSVTQDLLLEIGCEEMPSAPLMKAQQQLGQLVEKGLASAGLAHGKIQTFSTPRRLAVIVYDCADATEELHETLRGPKTSIAFSADGVATKAGEGFARKNGIEVNELVRRVADDGFEYVFAERHVNSIASIELVGPLFEQVIASIQWPNYRSQRWGSEHQSFVRPIRWICALMGSEVIPVCYADVVSSNTTRGHRVLAPGDHVVLKPSDYERTLEQAFVLTENRRSDVIRRDIASLEEERGGAHVDTPPAVFTEVVNLCEWPSVVVGEFDEEFLAIPHEIICESMLKHQRYFPIYAPDGSLTREFVIVSNADPAVNETVRAGNERVVRPRLDDAKFFYEEDLKVGLDSFHERLGDVIFHKRLGSVLQKAERMETLAGAVAQAASCDDELVVDAVRAARLAKADLVSQTVVEFTSQQGVMGGYYATAQGENSRVARAISEHYRPRFAGDELPHGIVGKAVAIADKLDTVCGLFAAGEPPTGSSDPFAVRRSAIGIIAMLRTLPSVALSQLIDEALESYRKQGVEFDSVQTAEAVRNFFAGRLAVIARDEGIAPDAVEAVGAIGIIDPAALIARAQALDDARTNAQDTFSDLATAFARAAHLTDPTLGSDLDDALMGDSEHALAAACDEGMINVEKALSSGDYAGACIALAELRTPIDRFFDDVLIMDEDTRIRENRLRLLNRFVSVFSGVADIGVLSKAR